ncbi:HAD family hydrolase [Robertkochia marina]|uniref:HAD family hydrolase n=1 Tax=Robertkochia marina TaxID=1227945 RepID=A0A4S3M006_9FLAO|nr:HAD family hydrolase [Robertkochia marina]THD66791.1 HAD family hydrolase [Robertkochia marina]TRZ41918.1 HAD family hydrolase [Robertkochia marina]
MHINVQHNTVIAFDLDDTLYKEIDYVRSAFREIARKLSIDHWLEIYLQMFSMFRQGKNTFDYLEQNYPVTKASLLDQYRNHIPDITPEAGVIALIEQIKTFKGKIGIITDGRTSTQNNKIDQLGLRKYLDFVFISEETGHDKHTPHNFETLMRQYPQSHFTYIADNPAKDFLFPNRMGWQTIGLLDNGTHIHKQLYPKSSEYLPDKWIFQLNDLHVFPSKSEVNLTGLDSN